MPLGHGPISASPVAGVPLPAAVITLRGTSRGPNTNVNSWSLSLPTGTTVGDLTLVSIGQAQSGSTAPVFTFPSGWTVLYNFNGAAVIYRVFQSGDPSSITISSTLATAQLSMAASYYNVDQTNPIDVWGYAVNPQDLLVYTRGRGPSVNPNYANDRVVVLTIDPYTTNAGSISSVSNGLTTQVSTGVGGAPNMVIADKALTSAANTQNFDVVWSSGHGTASLLAHHAITVALKTISAVAVTPATPTVDTAGSTRALYMGAISSLRIQLLNFQPKAGDLLIAGFACNAVPTTVPAGFTLIQSSANGCAYQYTATGRETVNPTFGWSSSLQVVQHTTLYRGVGSALAVGIDTSSIATATAASWTNAALTPTATTNEALHAEAWSTGDAGTQTIPSTVNAYAASSNPPSLGMFYMQPSTNPSGTYTVTTGSSVSQSVLTVLLMLSTNVTVALTGTKALGKYGALALTNTLAQIGKQALGKYGVLTPTRALAQGGKQALGKYGTLGVASSAPLAGKQALGKYGTLGLTHVLALAGKQAKGYAGTITAIIGVPIQLTGAKANAYAGAVVPRLAPALTGKQAKGYAGAVATSRVLTPPGTAALSYSGQVARTAAFALVGRKALAIAGHVGPQLSFGLPPTSANAYAGMVMTASNVMAQLRGGRAEARAGTAGYTVQLFTWWTTAAARAGHVAPKATIGLPRAAAAGSAHTLGVSESATRNLVGAHAAARAGAPVGNLTVQLLGARAAGRAGLVAATDALVGARAAARLGTPTYVLQLALTGNRAAARVGVLGVGEGSGRPVLARTGPVAITTKAGAPAVQANTQPATKISILAANNIFTASD